MKNINNFKLNRSLSPDKQNKILVGYVSEFFDNNKFKKIIVNLAKTFDIPFNNFEQDVKIYLFNNFNNADGKFFKRFNGKNIIKSFIKTLAIFIWIIFYSRKNFSRKKNYFLMVDNVDHDVEAYRFKSFLKKFKSYIIVSSVDLKEEINFFHFNKYKYIDTSKILKNKKLKILNIIFRGLLISISERTNYVDITLHLFKIIVKYEDIFSKINSKYLIQERQFNTSCLKNYLYKKHGGFKTLLFQRNIAQLNGPGMYTHCDYFFSLGKKTHLQYLKCNSYFEKIYPVGSFFMNSVKFNKSINSELPRFDILHIASNMNYFQNTHCSFMDDWIEQFNWLVKLNTKFPKLKICIKGRRNDGLRKNIRFMSIINNSNIKFIDDHKDLTDNKNFRYNSWHSYDYALNSDFVCTWQSTMGFELIGQKKPCVFLDPGGRNTAHLPNDDYHLKIKVTTYDQFEKTYFQIINNEYFFKNMDLEDYCMDSKYTHEKIANILNEQKINDK